MHLCLRREKEDDSRVLLLIDISPDFTQRELPVTAPLITLLQRVFLQLRARRAALRNGLASPLRFVVLKFEIVMYKFELSHSHSRLETN